MRLRFERAGSLPASYPNPNAKALLFHVGRAFFVASEMVYVARRVSRK